MKKKVEMFLENEVISTKMYPSKRIAKRAVRLQNDYFESNGMTSAHWKLG